MTAQTLQLSYWPQIKLYKSQWPNYIWYIVAAIILVDLIWLATPYVTLDLQSWILLISVWSVSAILVFAAHTKPVNIMIYTLVTGFAITLSLWPALKMLNHITMSYPLTLADPMLAKWDMALGLDWTRYVQWLDQFPTLILLMDISYGGLIQYCSIAFLALLLLKGTDRSIEFISLFVMSSTITILLGPLLPAQGAMIFHAPSEDMFTSINTSMGTYFWGPLSDIRNSSELNLIITDLPGLVAFPSFHTAMGILLIYASRGTGLLFIISCAFNLLMIASTPLFGGHYFVDLLSGTLLAILTIIMYNRLNKNKNNQSSDVT